MTRSWKIANIAGINAYVHWTFALVVLAAAWSAYNGAGTWAAVVFGVTFLLGVFASVLLHELGHALVARRYGVRTRRIVLTPIGGIAQLEGTPGTPAAEWRIAIAGPLVNIAIAALLALAVTLVGLSSSSLLAGLMVANLSLAAFNLLPAFPMDGGRILRAFLTRSMGFRRATTTAVTVGRVVAIAMGIVGLAVNPMLVLIAAFVWFAGSAEARATTAPQSIDPIDSYVRPNRSSSGFGSDTTRQPIEIIEVLARHPRGGRLIWIRSHHMRSP